MDFKIEEKEKDLTLVFSGKLDSITAPQAEDQVLPMLENSVYETITIDCTDLEYIASSGIRLFFAILKDGKSKGSRVALMVEVVGRHGAAARGRYAIGLSGMLEFV